MTDTSPAQKLTDNLLSVIRQQRHLATRVLISTQEPTISPKLLDLCNVIIAHRFTSPEWLSFMKRHLAAIAVEAESNDLLARIVGLNEGEAYLFAPAGIISNRDFEPIYSQEYPERGEGEEEEEDEDESEDVGKLGLGYLKIKVRKRLTEDGGKSILANSVAATVAPRTTGVIPVEIVAALVSKKSSSRGGRGGYGDRGRGRGQSGSSGRLVPPPNFPAQPRRFPPGPQQNGGGAATNGGWDQSSQSQQNNQQQPNANRNVNQDTWDPHQDVKVTPKVTTRRTQAQSNGTNGNSGGGAPLPRQSQQGQDDPNAGWG